MAMRNQRFFDKWPRFKMRCLHDVWSSFGICFTEGNFGMKRGIYGEAQRFIRISKTEQICIPRNCLDLEFMTRSEVATTKLCSSPVIFIAIQKACSFIYTSSQKSSCERNNWRAWVSWPAWSFTWENSEIKRSGKKNLVSCLHTGSQ